MFIPRWFFRNSSHYPSLHYFSSSNYIELSVSVDLIPRSERQTKSTNCHLPGFAAGCVTLAWVFTRVVKLLDLPTVSLNNVWLSVWSINGFVIPSKLIMMPKWMCHPSLVDHLNMQSVSDRAPSLSSRNHTSLNRRAVFPISPLTGQPRVVFLVLLFLVGLAKFWAPVRGHLAPKVVFFSGKWALVCLGALNFWTHTSNIWDSVYIQYIYIYIYEEGTFGVYFVPTCACLPI